MTSVAVAPPAIPSPSRPIARGLLVLIWLLPIHGVLMAALFGGLGVSALAVRLIAAWKEALIAVLLAVAIAATALGRSHRSPVHWIDLPVIGLALLAFAYLLGGSVWFGLGVPAGAQLYSLRDIGYFSLAYFLGRATPNVVATDRVLKALFAVGVITSAIAVLERLFVTPEMLVILGTAAYFQEFLGASLFTAANPYGLPSNYWVVIGDQLVQRAGSTYMSSQAFALPFLVIMPAVTAWLLSARRSAAAWAGYWLMWTGLLLTVTRMTIVACLLQVLVIAAAKRQWWLIVTGMSVAVAAFLAALVANPGLGTYVWETLTWQSASSVAHLADWSEGFENAVRHPFGTGLGTADQSAVRFGIDPLAGDNLYLTYAVQLGVLGLGCHLATMLGAVWIGIRRVRGGEPVRSDYGLLVGTAALGILLNSVTAGVFNSILLTCVFFWLLGSLVTPAMPPDHA